jgi:hypothetical protein
LFFDLLKESSTFEHIDKLAKKYLGVDKYPAELHSPDEKRIIVRIKPERAAYLTQGPPS